MWLATPLRLLSSVVYRFGSVDWRWRRELSAEAGFWSEYFAVGGGDWESDLRYRLDADSELRESLLLDLVEGPPASEVEILDVGAGPLTAIGKRHNGTPLRVTAVDPLGDEYNVILRRNGVVAPVSTLQCRGEDITERLGTDRFDIAYARNCLDHAADPMRIVHQMLLAVRPGGHVALRHYRNEARHWRYHGLHQWNFDVCDGELTVQRPRERHNITRAVEAQAITRAWLEDSGAHSPWVCAVLTREGVVRRAPPRPGCMS